jgi:hypothetical protein
VIPTTQPSQTPVTMPVTKHHTNTNTNTNTKREAWLVGALEPLFPVGVLVLCRLRASSKAARIKRLNIRLAR